jgi:hypothetical protein
MNEVSETATAVARTLAPFLPYLAPIGNELAGQLQEKLADSVISAAWARARHIWKRLTCGAAAGTDVVAAGELVSRARESSSRELVFREAIESVLREEPALHAEVLELVGGPPAVQRIIAGEDTSMQHVHQVMTGPGEQTIALGKGSTAVDVSQRIG